MTRGDRPAWRGLAITVAAVLVAGLTLGVAADIALGTRPVATLVAAVVAAQLAMLVVYRNIVASLRGIKEDSGEGEATEQS